VPDQDHAVALERRNQLELGLRGDALRVRNLDAFAVLALVAPAVEGTPNRVALDLAALAEVRAQVRAERVRSADEAVLARQTTISRPR